MLNKIMSALILVSLLSVGCAIIYGLIQLSVFALYLMLTKPATVLVSVVAIMLISYLISKK